MQRLDDVVGPAFWQCRYPFPGCCDIGIYLVQAEPFSGQWIWKSNGAGETDVEGEKGQYSDAFKRAAVLWGIGRYLYDLPNVWLALDPSGYKFAETPKLPTWATPGGWNRISSTIKREVYRQSVEALEKGDELGLKTVWDEFDNDPRFPGWRREPLLQSRRILLNGQDPARTHMFGSR